MDIPLTPFKVLNKGAEILKVIAHPIRLAIIELLFKQGKLSVTDIYQQLEVEQSVISYHLKNLRMVNVVESDRQGTKIYYSIDNDDVIEILQRIISLGNS